MFLDLWIEFSSFEQWLGWSRARPWVYDGSVVRGVVDEVRRNGVVDIDGQSAPPEDVVIDSENYRETIIHNSLSSRLRASLMFIDHHTAASGGQPRIYAPESVTMLAQILRGRYPGYVGSEYLPGEAERAAHPDVMHQDVQALTFQDASFDACLSFEVAEHVPDFDAMLAEARRILRPGGVFLSTFPFAYGQRERIVKASIEDGVVVHHMEPEYHGNPVDPEGGSLVFNIPGWDVLQDCRRAGFADARMTAIGSSRAGVTGADIPMIFLLCATA